MNENNLGQFILSAINQLMTVFYHRHITKDDLVIFISVPTLMKLVKTNPKLENWGYISLFGVDVKAVYDDGDFVAVGIKPKGYAKISAAINALLKPKGD